MISGAIPVINANADAPQPNPERALPQNRCGAKKDAASEWKSTRRPLCCAVATAIYHERPGILSAEVFFGRFIGSERLECLAGVALVLGLLFCLVLA
jgi:hypothetical protein